MRNNNGPRMHPCGTPVWKYLMLEDEQLMSESYISSFCFLFVRYDGSHLSNEEKRNGK